uniref:Integrase catalytic domain-containing protein n=1 Tax=Glossina palpalis gambiensis TaxID=67801 RepID=A0A1B0C337_9MUSC
MCEGYPSISWCGYVLFEVYAERFYTGYTYNRSNVCPFTCCLLQNKLQKATLQCFHIDYAGSYQSINAKSKWAEVGVWFSVPTSTSIIEMLSSISIGKRYLGVMVSDNPTMFRSDEFTKFFRNREIFQTAIFPEHPASTWR